jgi:hypothetical protein
LVGPFPSPGGRGLRGGEILSNRNDYNFSPPPQSSPVEGEEVIRLLNERIDVKEFS